MCTRFGKNQDMRVTIRREPPRQTNEGIHRDQDSFKRKAAMDDTTRLELTKAKLLVLRRRNKSLLEIAAKYIVDNLNIYLENGQLENLPFSMREDVLREFLSRRIAVPNQKLSATQFAEKLNEFTTLLNPQTRYIDLNGLMSFCPSTISEEMWTKVVQTIATNAPNVQSLSFGSKGISDFKQCFKRLKVLQFGWQPLRAWMSVSLFRRTCIQHLPKLQFVDYFGSRISDCPHESMLDIELPSEASSLRHLHTTPTPLSLVEAYPHLTHLTVQWFQGRQYQMSEFDSLLHFTKIEALILDDIPSAEILDLFLDTYGKDLRELKIFSLELRLKFKKIFESCPKLEKLTVKGAVMTDDFESIQFYDKLREFEYLPMNGTIGNGTLTLSNILAAPLLESVDIFLNMLHHNVDMTDLERVSSLIRNKSILSRVKTLNFHIDEVQMTDPQLESALFKALSEVSKNALNADGIFVSPVEGNENDIPNISISDYLLDKIKSHNLTDSDKPWVIDARTEVQVLFKHIEPLSKKIASGLARLGFKKDDVLYFVTYETAQLYLVQMAVWRLGGAVRGCYQQEAPEEYARQLRETRSRFILIDPETEDRMKQAAQMVHWDISLLSFGDVQNAVSVETLLNDDGSAFPEKVEFDKDDVVIIPNTSGSTGLPKGVLHTHATYLALSYNRNALQTLLSVSFMTPMSNYAVGSFMLTASTIVYGATVIHLGKFVKEQYIANLIKYKPGNCLMYPFVATWFARCDDLDQVDLSFLKMISCGGSVLDATTAELIVKKMPHVKVVQFYGMTETLAVANTEIMRAEDELDKKIVMTENEGEICVSSGKLNPYVQVKIIDEQTGENLGLRKKGLIHVKSPMIMKGYLSEHSREPVKKDIDSDGWFKTGDLGFFDEKGNIYVLERVSFMFKYFMFIVSPTEIEVVLQEHPDVLQVGVVGVPHPESTSIARAFVVLKKGRACSKEDLCQFVADRLPNYKHLHGGVVFVDSLPESRGNKLDRPALIKMVDVNSGTTVTFHDAYEKSKCVANVMARLGFKQGDVLYYVTYEMAQLFVLHLATWLLGGAVRGCYQGESAGYFSNTEGNCNNGELKAISSNFSEVYARQINESKARMVVVDFDTAPVVKRAIESLDWEVRLFYVGRTPVENAVGFETIAMDTDDSAMPEFLEIDPKEEVVAIPSTSGSTGTPKGVLHTHYSAVSQLVMFSKFDYMREDTRSMALMTNYAIGNFLLTLNALYSGATVYNIGKFSYDIYFDLILQYKPNFIMFYPFVASWFAKSRQISELDLGFIEKIFIAAWVLDPTTADMLHQKLPKAKITQLRENEWFHTGDLGFFDDEENIYVVERMSFMFKYLSLFVSPSEIESVLCEHPCIQAAGVTGIPDPEVTTCARAYVVTKPGMQLTEDEVCAFVAEKLPEYKHLHGGVRFLEKLPVNKVNADRIYVSPVETNENEIPNISICDYLLDKIKSHNLTDSDKPWVIDARTEVQVLFKHIEPLSKKIASGLARLGFKKDDVLYFVTYETAQLYLVQMAVWRLGGAVRGCYQQEAPEEYARQLRETRSRFILIDPETEGRMKQAAQMVHWDISLLSFGDVQNAVSVETLLNDDGSAFPEKIEYDSSDVIIIPNTSGSTGLPKGVLHTHATFLTLSYNRNAFQTIFDASIMTPMSNYAVGSFMMATNSVAVGATVIHLGKFEREQYIPYLIKYKPRVCLMYPFIATWFARCDDVHKVDLSFLKKIVCGGSVLDPTTAELIRNRLHHVKLIQMYGMTECLSLANTEVMKAENELDEIQADGCTSTGKLAPFVQAKIIDQISGDKLNPNKKGLIYVKSPMIMKGYLSEHSREPVKKDIDSDGWFKTGDLGFFDEKGNLYISERVSFMFKYFMFIVSPTEIEVVLQEHPDVLQVGVVGVPHPESTSIARAFVVLKKGRACSKEDLCQFVADRLPNYKHLHGGVVFVDSLPESRGNKLDRPALKKMAIEQSV
ncbi:Hypothetical predicted protein [Cloeon dipterum]|uniref:Uncharacterized protein n=1 Tax=Cloeon dipterum TaxID=197152 RepID=A0A8S1C8K0_9INSE|nr:Hypothetical predicted protein [Cloeon dipterum]